ncbi:MAG: hypothetical protein ACK4S6_07380 [Roseateles asaccharophilus]|uniref:Uncharacterized protein n=2 Tax=Roseateles asaccharophilus TaxID=582607 RepID=A0A4R6N9V2_9BURK|nr:hypothetical protein [Roseateles asaccharophilus]MDN3543563.1 hypothetical protein [Roseateles asaccharophilus]TDP12060.1 hypothetical protein DFR39_102448 [Roseateles asaccharophilus]
MPQAVRHLLCTSALMKKSRLLALLLALWMSALCAAPLSSANPPNELRGTWLIAPKPHDFLIETGVVSAEYPILAIDEDDTFRAYRFGIACASELTSVVSEVNRIEPCMRNLGISNVDRLTGLAIPIAEGRVVRSEVGWLLKPNDSKSLAEAIGNATPSNQKVDGIPYQFAIFVNLFGEPLSASINNNELVLGSVNKSFTYSFVRVDVRQLVGVGSLLNVIGLPYGQYFRCAMKNIHDAVLLRDAERVQEAYNLSDQQFYEQLRRNSQEDVLRGQALRQEASDLTVALFNRYGREIDLQQRFGAFAGCPDRDRR